MRHRLTGSFGVLVAALAFSPIVFAQTNQPSETKKAPAASSSPAKRPFPRSLRSLDAI